MFKLYNKNFSNLLISTSKIKPLRISNFTNIRKTLTLQEVVKGSGLSIPLVSEMDQRDYNNIKLTDILKYLKGCRFNTVRFVILDNCKRRSPPLLAIPSLRKLKKITQKEHYEKLNVSRKDLISLELDMVNLHNQLTTKSNLIELADIPDSDLKLGDIILYLGVIGYPISLDINMH